MKCRTRVRRHTFSRVFATKPIFLYKNPLPDFLYSLRYETSFCALSQRGRMASMQFKTSSRPAILCISSMLSMTVRSANHPVVFCFNPDIEARRYVTVGDAVVCELGKLFVAGDRDVQFVKDLVCHPGETERPNDVWRRPLERYGWQSRNGPLEARLSPCWWKRRGSAGHFQCTLSFYSCSKGILRSLYSLSIFHILPCETFHIDELLIILHRNFPLKTKCLTHFNI